MSSEPEFTGVIDASQLATALERLRTVSNDVTEMKSSMVQMAGAVTRLAVMEERLGYSREAQERAFNEISELKKHTIEELTELRRRLRAVEDVQPASTQTTRWVNQAIGLVIAAAIGAVGTTVMTNRRADTPVPQIEQRQ